MSDETKSVHGEPYGPGPGLTVRDILPIVRDADGRRIITIPKGLPINLPDTQEDREKKKEMVVVEKGDEEEPLTEEKARDYFRLVHHQFSGVEIVDEADQEDFSESEKSTR